MSRRCRTTQNQLSTGKSINSPADNPVAAVQLLQLNSTNAQYQQYVSNGQSANTNLSLEAGRTDHLHYTLQSIRDLVVQANSGSNNTSDLQDIATQISALESQLQGTANSQNAQGEYLFAGYSTGTQPFVRGSSGSMSYVGDSGVRSVQIASGTSVQTGDPGAAVFMNNPSRQRHVYDRRRRRQHRHRGHRYRQRDQRRGLGARALHHHLHRCQPLHRDRWRAAIGDHRHLQRRQRRRGRLRRHSGGITGAPAAGESSRSPPRERRACSIPSTTWSAR